MRWLLFLPLLILLAVFALSNMQEVQLRMWPLDIGWAAPLGVAVLVLAGLGFLVGALLVWASGLATLRRARRMEEAAKLLEPELTTLKMREQQMRHGSGPMRISLPSGT